MKRKNQIIKRICAVLCAFVVAISGLGSSGTYFAADSRYEKLSALFDTLGVDISRFTFKDDYLYVVSVNNKGQLMYVYGIQESDYLASSVCIKYDYGTHANSDCCIYLGSLDMFEKNKNTTFWYHHPMDNRVYSSTAARVLVEHSGGSIVYSDLPIVNWDGTYTSLDFSDLYYVGESGSSGESFNSSLGYLQNVTRKSTYIRDALYNFDEESLTYHWTHDLTSTSGLDLSSGNYKIRHYISKATVNGYEKENIIEMSDKYLVGDYDASDGGFSYLKKDYDDKIAAFGYENIGWVDKYLKGYFVLEHNYFQIVNSATNEVGGYLHFYPKDSDSDSFGVEYEYEGLDNDFAVDEDGPSGFIDNQTGSGLTHEEALENAEQPKLDDLGGVDELTANLDAYASQIGGVTNGIGALFGQLPPWIVGLLGLSVALSFAVVVFKVLRG